MGKNTKLTLQDIAREAGVSLTTASMYLNGKARRYKIAESTCKRIEEVIKRNNFLPNIHARAMAFKKTMIIGVIVDGINSSFWGSILQGVEGVIVRNGYHVLLGASRYNFASKEEMVSFMSRTGVDGFIFSPVLSHGDKQPDWAFIRDIAAKKPVVSVALPLEGLPSVYNDNVRGGRIAAQHLLAKGHTKIAFVGHVENICSRGKSFIRELEKRGIAPGVFDTVVSFIPHVSSFTAAFCYSDFELLDLYGKTAAAGIKIPDQLSVIGYDNMPFLEFLTPRPTSIHQHKKELGIAAAEMLMHLLMGDNADVEPPQKVFKPKLIEGASVKDLSLRRK